jgi:hypothetical protein
MVYDWSQIGSNEITNLYLYGTLTTPNDLFSDANVRPNPLVTPTILEINQASYMETGQAGLHLGLNPH